MISLYRIDACNLPFDQRDELIETRVSHRQEMKSLYEWLRFSADADTGAVLDETLAEINFALAELSRSVDFDAQAFVRQLTGWTEEELEFVRKCVYPSDECKG